MISQWGVSGEKNPFAATKAAPMKALTVSSLRKPVRSRMRFAMVFMNSAPTAAMKVREPEASGLRPKPTCSISGRRKGMAPMPMRKRKPPTTLMRKVGIFKRPSCSTGYGVRRAWKT